MSAPIITIMMPCFNARTSLPWAIGSVLAQTFADWELVIVDDGSSDRPEDIIDRADDARIRLIRLPENRGRGYARQVALDNAQGQYIAMLDADDWIYRTHLESLVEALREHPEAALATSGFSIANRERDLTGVRHQVVGDERLQVLGPVSSIPLPPVAHAASMYRGEQAREIRYDARLRMAEDMDFLLQLLMGRRYCVLSTASYVYTEWASMSEAKMVGSLRSNRAIYRKFRAQYPWQSRLLEARLLGREALYRGAYAIHLDGLLVQKRSREPSSVQRARYLFEREIVYEAVTRAFGDDADAGGKGP